MDILDEYNAGDLTAKVLEKIIKLYPDLMGEPLRFEGLLRDIYGSEYKKEIFLLTTALKAKIIDHFGILENGDNIDRYIDIMISKLSLEFGLDRNSSVWVTITWAVGLKKLSEDKVINILNNSRYLNNSSNNDYSLHTNKKPRSFDVTNSDSLSNLLLSKALNSKDLYENGISLHNQGKYLEAIECYDKALAIDPQNCDVFSNKGLSLHNQGKYLEAIECYDKALAIDPQNEFIIRRREHTYNLIQRPTSKYKSISNNNQLLTTKKNNKQKSFNLYILGIVIATVFLIGGGVTVFVILGTGYNLNSGQTNGDTTSKKLQPAEKADSIIIGSGLSKDTISKESISEFTDSIKMELNKQFSKENKSSKVMTTQPIVNDTSNSLEKNIENIKSSIGLNQKVDTFKTELEMAMTSNFS